MQYKTNNIQTHIDGNTALTISKPNLVVYRGLKHLNNNHESTHIYKPQKASPVQFVFAFTCAFVLLVTLIVTLYVSQVRSRQEFEEFVFDAPAQTMIVTQGDTLWSIANNYKSSYMSSAEVMSWIKVRNHIENGYLQIGQMLEVPII